MKNIAITVFISFSLVGCQTLFKGQTLKGQYDSQLVKAKEYCKTVLLNAGYDKITKTAMAQCLTQTMSAETINKKLSSIEMTLLLVISSLSVLNGLIFLK